MSLSYSKAHFLSRHDSDVSDCLITTIKALDPPVTVAGVKSFVETGVVVLDLLKNPASGRVEFALNLGFDELFLEVRAGDDDARRRR